MLRCFVMQPFDNSEFDRRYDQIYKPAIEASGFDPYRVDRDPRVSIPIQSIENEIRSSSACFVDISVDNPNVWFEFGFAISAFKPVCIVSSKIREKFPFDIQHRKVIRYDTKAPSDFADLSTAITERLANIAEHEIGIERRVEQTSSQTANDALTPAEFQVLCALFEETVSDDDNISFSSIENEMYRVGYNKLATRVGLIKLSLKNFIKRDSFYSGADSMWYMLENGRNYVLEHVDEESLRTTPNIYQDDPN